MALQKLNDFEVHGKAMKLSYAEPQRPLDEEVNDEQQVDEVASVRAAVGSGASSSANAVDHVEGVRIVVTPESDLSFADDDADS